MRRRPPRYTLTYTLFPNTPLFRAVADAGIGNAAGLDLVQHVQLGPGAGGEDQPIADRPAFGGLAVSLDLDPVVLHAQDAAMGDHRSEEHTSELQSLMRSSYAVFCLKKKNTRLSNIITFYNI